MKLFLICISFVLASVTAPNVRCYRRADYGNCKGHHFRWTYSNMLKKCVPFDYSGCGGNDNRFDSWDQCDWICYKLRVMAAKEAQGTGMW